MEEEISRRASGEGGLNPKPLLYKHEDWGSNSRHSGGHQPWWVASTTLALVRDGEQQVDPRDLLASFKLSEILSKMLGGKQSRKTSITFTHTCTHTQARIHAHCYMYT